MSIENLSSEIKNIFYKEDIDEDVAVEESEEKSPEEEKLTDELAVTLDFDPAMPDEEIFMEFPEFDNNADMLSLYKKRAMKKGGDSLKKKDEIPVSEGSLEDLAESESEVPSTSLENPLDDPNLTAGGDNEVQAQVSTDVAEETVEPVVEEEKEEDLPFQVDYKIARKGDPEFKEFKGNRRRIDGKLGIYVQKNYQLNDPSWTPISPNLYRQNISKDNVTFDEQSSVYTRKYGDPKEEKKQEVKEEVVTETETTQYSDAGDEDNELFFPDPTTPISMVELQKAAIRNKLGSTPATEKEIDAIVRDFAKKHDVAKEKMITDITAEIDATGLKPTSKGFNKEVMSRVNKRTYADLNNYLLVENENIAVPKGALETDILDIAPRILMNYYDNLSVDVLEDFKTYFTKELQEKQAKDFAEEKKRNIRQAMGPGITGDIRSQAPNMLEGFSTQSGIFEQTKADKSKNIMKGIYKELSKPIYDDIPREWIDFIAQQTADRYHQSTPEFLEMQNTNRMKVLEEYNLNRTTPLLLPQQAYDQAVETIANLSGASERDKNEIIKDKYGITFNEDGTANWSDEYLEELEKVIGETDRLTYEDYKNENKMEKNILMESIEGTLAGQIFTYMTDMPMNPEYGVVYEDYERFIISVGNIALDLTLPLLGVATKGASKLFIAKKQKDLMKTFSDIKKAQYDAIVSKTGPMSAAQKKALTNKLDLEMANHLKKYQGKVQVAGGAATLGVWEAAHTAVSDLHQTNDITEVNLSLVIGSGIKGGILGGSIAKLGMKALQVENQIKSLGFKPLTEYSLRGGVKGGALVGEAGIFVAGTSIYEGIKEDKTIGEIVEDATSPKTLAENLAYILGLRAAKIPVKLAKGELFKAPKGSNTGIYTFKLTEAEKEYMGVKDKTDKEVYKEIEKTINGPNTEKTLEFIEALPLNVLNKYAFSSSGSQIRVDNPLDAVEAKWETNSERPGEVVIRNDKGIILDVKNFGTAEAAEKYITTAIRNNTKNRSNLILTEEMLTTENKAKLNVELEKVGLTIEELKKLNLQEEINPKDRVTLESANEKVVEIYRGQRAEIEKVVKQFEADTEGMSTEQREEVLKARIKDAKVEEKDRVQKEKAGIEELSPIMRGLNEMLGKKPEEPIEVTEANKTKLEEAAKTDLQKEAIKDIITATEALKGTEGKVIVHTDNSSYQKALNAVEKGNVAELIGGHRDVKTGDVHFNLNAINKRTAFHELAGHKLVEEIRKSSPEKIERIENEVYNLIKKLPEFAPILDFINQKAQGKEVYTEAEKRSEALAELMARSAKGEVKINQNNKFVDGLKNKLNTLMKKLGIDYRFATNSEALTFIADVSNKLAKGKTIEVEKPTEVKKETKEPTKIQKRVNQQVDYHNKNEGSTFDQKGKPVTEGYSVSRYPERSRIIEGKEVSAEQLEKYIKDNQDILSKNPNAVIGTWYNKEDGKTYLDISEVQKNLEKAKQVGVEANQIAIFDLKNFKEIPTGGTGKALSEKQIARNNFNNKVKLIRQEYKDKIQSIKEKTKEKDNALKKVKSDLINYIKEADHLNTGIKKSVLKNAVNVNTPEKLDRFISTVEEIAAKESLSSSVAEAKALSKKVKKKLKKGLYTSQSKTVQELLNKDFSQIEDLKTLTEVNDVLKDLNRQKQPLVNPEQIKKLSNQIEKTLKNVEGKEPKIPSLDKINSNIEKVKNKLQETKLDAKSVEGAKEALSLARSIESLKKDLYKAEQAEKVTEVESDKIKSEIQKLEKKAEGMLTEFNTERFNLSKDILNNSDLKSFNKYEKEQIEQLKELQFVDNTGHNDNLLVAAINVSNGFPPINNISRLIVESNNNRNSKNLSDLIKDRVDKFAGKRVGMFKTLSDKADKLAKQLAYTPLGLISERFRAERDVKNAGLIDKVIIAPLTRAMSRYEKDVKKSINDWSTVGNSTGSKIVNWMKTESSGRLLSIPFTKGANPLYHKKQISDNKVGVILAQMERNSVDGKNVLKTILENKNLLSSYSTAEQLYLKNIYKNLPKKTVDGKEVIDIDKAMKQLSSREQKMVKKFRELMDGELMPKQNFANGIRGIAFEGVENYYPHILKPGAKKSVVSEKEAFANWSDAIFKNNNKVASDAGKERVSTDINAIEFNVNKVVMDRIKQVNRDFHFTQPINEVRELLKDAKNNSSKDYEMYFNALSGRMRDATTLHLNMHASGLNRELLAPFMQAVYSSSLLRPGRLITELGTETIRVGVGAAERIQDLPNTFKAIFDRSATTVANKRNAVDKIFTKELGEKESIDTALNTILEMTDSPFLHKYSRHDVEFGKDVGGQNGLLNRLSNWGLGAVDRNTLFMAYMPAFTKEFKSITGKEFSYSEVKKPEYQKKYKQAILDAAAIGDRAASQWKNVSVKGQGRTAILTPFGGVKASSEFAPILTFMGSFGYLETAMYQKSVRDVLAGESAGTKGLGAKNAASILTAGVAYGTAISAEMLITKYLTDKYIILQSKEGDDKMAKYDEDAELLALNAEFREEMQKIFTVSGIQKQMISNSAFLLTSKYSAASRALMMVAGGTYDEWLKSANSAKEMNKSQIVKAIEENDSWLREVLEAEEGTSTAKALIKGGLYATPTVNPGKVAEQMLPHLDNMMNTMLQEFPEAFWKWYAEGNADQVTGARQTHEKFRDELQFANLAQQALRMYFMMRGTAMPVYYHGGNLLIGDRMIERYFNEMMKRYDKPTISFQEAIQPKYDRFGKTDRFGKSNKFGKPE